MAFPPAGAAAKGGAAPMQGTRPDPLLQPALANAMRLGQKFAALAGQKPVGPHEKEQAGARNF